MAHFFKKNSSLRLKLPTFVVLNKDLLDILLDSHPPAPPPKKRRSFTTLTAASLYYFQFNLLLNGSESFHLNRSFLRLLTICLFFRPLLYICLCYLETSFVYLSFTLSYSTFLHSLLYFCLCHSQGFKVSRVLKNLN